METKDIILIVVLFAAVGISMYRKYAKKNQGINSGGKGTSNSSQTFSSKDDDYEPYSGK